MKTFKLLIVAALTLAAAQPVLAQTVPSYIQAATGNTLAGLGTANIPVPMATLTAASPNTITTGGASQLAFAANLNRLYLFCQNPIAATETLFVNIGAVAVTTGSTSFELAPGGSISFNSASAMPTGTVNVTAVTSAHAFICKQG